ncbi:MAG TPA: class I SAM-dependent rRNA methyltransferase [Ignavibacteria bacterium]|nr:class I SAM-dependent rRNA methyltransferase [Ignavibacteria bacterium]
MAAVFLKKNESRRIRNGHLWVFSNEVAKTEGGPETGALVELYDNKDFLGTGFYNKNSLITLRLLSPLYKDDLFAYIKESILNAYTLRKNFYPNRESFRLVFSESDFLPGLIIDKYNNTFVLQVYSFGMNENISIVVDVLKSELNAENIFTRNDPYFRKLEGLPEDDSVYLGEVGNEVIDDGKLKYRIDFASSQKTGFYFDQCDNRDFAERISAGKTVLDTFCNSGGFGMHAAAAGAGYVTFLDSSAVEISNAEKNFALNGLTSETDFVVMDVFDYLQKSIDAGRTFDVVMVDPPAFAKSRKSIPTALKGYAKLNKMAASCVGANGFLVTSSCSHHINRDDFIEAVVSGAAKAGKILQQVHFSGPSMDHPMLPAMDETTYLKFVVFKVI